MKTIFTPDEVREYYEVALAHERALSNKYFLAAITYKGDFKEYNRLMDLNAAAQARAMALWQEMDTAIEQAEKNSEKMKECESIKPSIWSDETVQLKPKRIIVRKLPTVQKLTA